MMIRIIADMDADLLTVVVSDNGRGIPADMVARVTDPFSTTRTTRKVGLGLSLLKEACETAGGQLQIDSTPHRKTDVTASFKISSVDRIPLGDVGDTLAGLISSYPDLSFSCEFIRRPESEFRLDTQALRENLGDVSLSDPNVYVFVRDYIREQQQLILGGI